MNLRSEMVFLSEPYAVSDEPECCDQCDKENVDLCSYCVRLICAACCAEDDADIAALME